MDPKDNFLGRNDVQLKNGDAQIAQKLFDDWKDSIVQIKTEGGIGTGFFVSPDTIATDYHVIRGSRTFKAIDSQSRVLTLGEEVYADPKHDIALLKVYGEKPPGIKPIPLAAEDIDYTGVRLYHLGHPKAQALELIAGVVKGGCNERDYYTRVQAQVSEGKRLDLKAKLANPQNESFLSEKLMMIEAPGVTHGSSGAPFLDEHGKAVGMVRKGVRNEDGTVYCASIKHLQQLLEMSQRSDSSQLPESEFFARKGRYETGIEHYFGQLRTAPSGFFRDSVPLAIAGTGAALAGNSKLNDGFLRATGLRMNVGFTVSGLALIPLTMRDYNRLGSATDDLTERKYGTALAADGTMSAGFAVKTVARLSQPRPASLRMGRAGLVLGGIGLAARLGAEFIPSYYSADIPYLEQLK